MKITQKEILFEHVLCHNTCCQFQFFKLFTWFWQTTSKRKFLVSIFFLRYTSCTVYFSVIVKDVVKIFPHLFILRVNG